MLRVSTTYFRTDRPSLTVENQELNNCLVGDVIKIADLINDLPEISSRPGGASGHKGWISINKDGLMFYVYFIDGVVDFELFLTPAIEECSYCSGQMNPEEFKLIMMKIDDGSFNLIELRINALSIDCSTHRHGS